MIFSLVASHFVLAATFAAGIFCGWIACSLRWQRHCNRLTLNYNEHVDELRELNGKLALRNHNLEYGTLLPEPAPQPKRIAITMMGAHSFTEQLSTRN